MSRDLNTLDQFLTDLASRAGTPGGGAASALVGAIASALCGMVGRLNDKLDGAAGPLHETIPAADALRADLAALIDHDIEAFKQLAATWKLPTDDPANAATRQKATIDATESPLAIMAKAVEVMELAAAGLRASKRNCVSDAGVAAILAQAAIEAARLNVLINLPGIADVAARETLHARCEHIRERGFELRRQADSLMDGRFDLPS